MNEHKMGVLLLSAILLIAVGTVFSASISHYAAEKDGAVKESYYEGMLEMHNSMVGEDLEIEEVLELHEKGSCLIL